MSINNKKTVENTVDFFDDDFEVIYQEEVYSKLLRNELEGKNNSHKKIHNPDDNYRYDNVDYEDGYDADYDYNNERYDTDYDYDYNNERYDADYDDYDGYGNRQYGGRSNYGRRRHKVPDLISPTARTAKNGVTILCRLINLLLRSATLILIAVIIYILAMNFWKNHSAYGNPLQALTERNYILAAYAAVAAFLLLFEVFSFLLVLATSKRNDRLGRRVDTGRGLFSFIFIYAGSYLAFFFNGLVPLTPSPLLGVQGALKIYGSMRTVLLPLCIAGIISCLVRKFAVH